MELHDKQKEVISTDKRFKVLNWGRRSGKTTVLGYDIFTELWNKEGLVSYYAPTYSDARDIAWEIFREILNPITVKTNETLLEIVTKNHKKTNSILRLAGWESVKNRDKGRGLENNLVVLDECAFYPSFKEKYEKVIEPTLLTSKGRAIFSSTPNGFNHFYDLSNTAQSKDNYFYSHATSYDNPFNSKEELDRLKEQLTDDAFSQEYLADFRKMEGLVFKEFSREKHVFEGDWREKAKGFNKLIGTVDFGFTNPCAIYDIYKDNDNKYYVTNELYRRGMTDEEIGDVVSNRRHNICYPDPENAGGIEVLKRKGVNVRDVIKGSGSVKNGVNIIRELFKQNRLFIHNECYSLIWELEVYSYPEKRGERNEDENPVKVNDHAIDSIRYGLMMEENTPLISKYEQSSPLLQFYPDLGI